MIVKQVAFVLQLIDDFNGRVVKNNKFIFEINNILAKPVEKPEGLYVFLEPMDDIVELKISSGYFHAKTVVIEKETLDEKKPIAKVRLYGKPGSGYSRAIQFISGNIEDKSVTFPAHVYAKSTRNTGLTFKELRQEEGQEYLICNGFTKEEIIGQTFCLKGEKSTEIFVLQEKKGVNGYRIEDKLSGEYDPGTPIERVFRSYTDKEGYYSIPVNANEQDKIKEVIIL